MNWLKTILVCSILTLFFSSCEEIFEDQNADEGTEYLEFKVDGKRFESLSVPARCNGLNFSYFPEPHLDLSPGFMEMVAQNCPDSTSLSITFQRVVSEYTGSGSFESQNFAEFFQAFYRAENKVVYNRFLDGTLTISEFSGSHKKGSGRLSGTFEMRLLDYEKSDTISITDGKFNFFITQKLH